MSDGLPDGVLFEILSWLPVKAIIRFKCVSKTWCFLISSPHFITTHLNRSRSNPKQPPYLFLAHFDDHLKIGRLTLPSFDDPFHCRNFIEWRSIHRQINQSKFIVGSSNGLLCLATEFVVPLNGSYFLWNPSIQKVITLPNPNVGIRAQGLSGLCHGFGYAPKTDDYKLVRIAYHNKFIRSPILPIPCLVQIYTLRTRTWRTIMDPGPLYYLQECFSLAFLNGAVHWPAIVPQQHPGARRNVIVSFDMEDDTFREVGMPRSLQVLRNWSVVVVDGMLALVLRNSMVEDSISVWVMKEYGVVESWTKLFDINNVKSPDRVIGFGECGNVLLNKGGKLFSYEQSSQRTVGLPFRGPATSFYSEKYVESLVLLNVQHGDLGQPNWLARSGEILPYIEAAIYCLLVLEFLYLAFEYSNIFVLCAFWSCLLLVGLFWDDR